MAQGGSIHAPVKGRLRELVHAVEHKDVSIHAPVKGRQEYH